MAVIYVCDGCGKQEPGEVWPGGWFKPSEWFQRRDRRDERDYHACSRECIDAIAEKTGSTIVVRPV